MQTIYYCHSSKLEDFFRQLSEKFKVFSVDIKDSGAKEKDYYYRTHAADSALVYNPFRPVEPLKSFFTSPLEKVVDYFTPEKNVTEITAKTIIFGLKNCDLYGHKIQDYVFLEGVEVDTLYRLRRENTIFVASDCTDFKQVCHCLAWEVLPHPSEGFDLNISPLSEGFLVEVGSKKGEELIQLFPKYFLPAKETQILARQQKREALIERLKRHLLPQNLISKDQAQDSVKSGYALDTWKNFMLTCVECGGCNLICDTCHCFLLADKKVKHTHEKVRVWDSCLYANYAKVAGGANPLKTRAMRLRNRFMKKFDFFVDNFGAPACCGCGRCIEVCPGKIDIREVLKDLRDKIAHKV